MLQTLSCTKIYSGAAIDDNSKVFALGANQALTFAPASTGGGSYQASATPKPDRMRVQSFSATLTDANSRPFRGVRLVLGMLAAFPHDPLVFLTSGIVGAGGDLWVRARAPFLTEFGLFVQLPYYLPSATYHVKAMVAYENA